ncbi:MAG: metal ABC transporter ATP-binding protein [Thermoprotei archaeon]|nr:MAG: metal ABC transporter ATP-binding protein [Thermoprotei archaeon]RLE98013.1 MAG: metal ABC transporter ATP-binding protein [Thermoprotei archaeon]
MMEYRPLMEFRGVEVRYQAEPALIDVSFRIEEPAFTVIVGPNGAGKTTLLKTALGLVKPTRGRVVVLGVDVVRHPWRVRRMVGYVPQRERIDQTMPALVRDVVLMGRALRRPLIGRLSDEDREAALRALERVGLSDLWDAPFAHLSGGQQQRVLIARALAAEPRLLLLDEPLSGVDAASQEVIVSLLADLARSGVGVVMVTHDLNPVLDCADYVLLLNKRLIAFGRPAELVEPDLLSKTYGKDVKVFRMGTQCFVISGDAHA